MRRFYPSSLPISGLAVLAVLLPFWQGAPAWSQKPKDQGGPKHIFTGPPPAHPFDVILCRPTDRSITVSVVAYEAMEAFIAYGTEKESLVSKTPARSLPPQQPVEFAVQDLKPDTRYYYRLQTRALPALEFKPEPLRTFQTQRRPGGSFVFTIQADSHLDQSTRPAVYERTLTNALSDEPDFHIDLGDTFMTDKYPNYKDALPQYVAQRYYFGLIAHSAPLFLVLGNHDGERLDRFDGTADCMPAWACQNRKKYFPNPFPDGFYSGSTSDKMPIGRFENYYAWEWGDALFMALDPFWATNQHGRNKGEGNWARTLGREQYQWLEKTLAGSRAKFKFVFIHHLVGGLDESARGGAEAAPLYEWGGAGASGMDEFREKRPGWTLPIHQLLAEHKVSAVFHGHDHFFARQDYGNIVYLMVPQPGHPGFDRLRNVEDYGYVRGDFLPPSGHLRVTVSPNRAIVEYVRAYLPQNENAERRNGQIGYSLKIEP